MTLRELAIDLVDHIAGDLAVWHTRTLSPWQREHLVVHVERKLGEWIHAGELSAELLQALRRSGGYCADPRCRCHVGTPAERVKTPFPVDEGPPYCCNRCARRPLVVVTERLERPE